MGRAVRMEEHPAVLAAEPGDGAGELAGGVFGVQAGLRAAHVGAYPAGVDGDDDDLVRGEQPGGADGDGVEGGLGGVVADVPADLGADGHGGQPGGQVDHRAGGAVDELGKQCPGDQHGPGGVDLDLGQEVPGADLERAAPASIRAEGPGVGPGGVDQQVDVSGCGDLRGELGDQVLV